MTAQPYFEEIEGHFAARRGTPFILSAKDWALMKSWHDEGVPLPVVIEAIDSVFEKNETSGRQKKINSLSYCRHAVKELWDERRELTVSTHVADAAIEVVVTDTGDVWVIRYDALLAACVACPDLLTILHEAMSREIGRDRDSLMSLCTLPADARVAEFLRYWADSLAQRGLRSDQITLRMTRAEIGNYLGMTLETVSRALSKLARDNVIDFAEKGRRDVRIPNVEALSAFIQRCLSPAPMLQ